MRLQLTAGVGWAEQDRACERQLRVRERLTLGGDGVLQLQLEET